ncbi:hypothetical protein D9M71_194970 [compost metagenome]
MGCAVAVTFNAPDLVRGILWGGKVSAHRLGAQRPDHEKVAVAVTGIQRSKVGVGNKRLAEWLEQHQPLLQVACLGIVIGCQQAEQVADGLIGVFEVEPYFLLDLCKQLLAARQDQLAGLPIIEQPEHNPREQQKEREHGTDMHMQRKATLFVCAHGGSLAEVELYCRF